MDAFNTFDTLLMHELIHRPGGILGKETYRWLPIGGLTPARASQNAGKSHRIHSWTTLPNANE